MVFPTPAISPAVPTTEFVNPSFFPGRTPASGWPHSEGQDKEVRKPRSIIPHSYPEDDEPTLRTWPGLNDNEEVYVKTAPRRGWTLDIELGSDLRGYLAVDILGVPLKAIPPWKRRSVGSVRPKGTQSTCSSKGSLRVFARTKLLQSGLLVKRGTQSGLMDKKGWILDCRIKKVDNHG